MLPLVTLGFPVYNGERYLARALQSALAQDYPNLEILISDNGSTDRTEAISREFAAADKRIRYIRQEENIGAKNNFELLVAEASGSYFAWCAHDDVRRPRFVRACVEVLERHPSAVLCNGMVKFLDEEGGAREEWIDFNFQTLAMTQSERMLRLVDHTHWVEIYGLIKIDALRQALPLESVWGFDVVFCMRLLSIGDFLKVPEVLFDYRVRSKPKDVEKTMEEVTGTSTTFAHPFLDMLDSMLRVAFEVMASQHERDSFFRDYLRTLVKTESQGHYPSWLELMASTCTPEIRQELAPLFLATHLLPRLNRNLSIEAFLDGEVRTILLGCPSDSDSLMTVPEMAAALRDRYPTARLLLIGSPHALAKVFPLGETKRFQLASHWSREASHSLIKKLVREEVDLAIHPGVTRKDVSLDICLTHCGAFRTVGFKSRFPNLTRAFVGKLLKRYRLNDMNKAFTHPLDPCSAAGRSKAVLEALSHSEGTQHGC